MNLEEFYISANGSLEEAMSRVPSKQLLLKLLKMFLADPNKAALDNAILANDPEAAFKAVHTLKGVTLSLGIKKLSNPLVELTEKLRGGSFKEGWKDNYGLVCFAYNEVTENIKQITD